METNTEKIEPKKVMSRSRKKLIFYILVMAYPLIQFSIFYIGVNINSILLAFKEYDFEGKGYAWIGFKQFSDCITLIKTDAVFRYAFKNSFITYLISAVVSSLLALFFSFYIYKKKAGSTFFRIMLFVPSIISPLVLAILFNNMAEDALPRYVLSIFGAKIQPLLSGKSAFAVLNFYRIWVGFGTSILIYNGSMAAIDVSVTEAAKLDGATGLREFIYIIFPLIYSTFVTFFIVGLAALFTEQMNLYSFYGTQANISLYTIGYYLYEKTAKASITEYPLLSAFGLMLTLVTVPVVFAVKWLMRKIGPSVN